jgi:predicted RNA-binding Zn ribbon-like protein
MPPMDEQLDSRLERVAAHASHPGLRALDVTVLDRIARERVGRARARRLDAISFAGALVIGIASSVTFAAPPAASTSSPLTGLSPLAPSALLERPR